MDSAMYTLVGALGGIIITQVANYFLESKRAKSLLQIKQVELESSKSQNLARERRLSYSQYLEELDHFVNGKHLEPSMVAKSYYSALFVSSQETAEVISEAFNVSQNVDATDKEIMNIKSELIAKIQSELQS